LQLKPIKKIFVCEFITGGGLRGEPLPDSLAKEGALMRDALLNDLSELPYQIIATVDARLAAPVLCTACVTVQKNDDVWQVWQTQIQAADAVWLIAPETDGILLKLTQIAALEGALVLGCGLSSIEICSEKLATYLALKQADILTLPTFTYQNWLKGAGCWLAKPNDGAGCDETVCFERAEDLHAWLVQHNKQQSHVIQAYQTGVPASISCVIHNAKAQLLSCNTQIIEINHHTLSYKGSIINGMSEHWRACELLANKIAATLPDLAGYVGFDVIVNDGEIVVVEINPRLTTSYVGLREATGANPAELIINTLTNLDFKWPTLQQNQVEIHV
jgi:tyramine---L-glutamate ligase